MENDEFNDLDPHEMVDDLYDDIVKQIPSSFAKVDSLTPVMLQSMNVMLDQAVKWLQGVVTGNIFGTPNPVNADLPELGDTIPDAEPDAGLNHFNQEQVLALSDTQVTHFFNNQQLLGASTRLLIIQEHERRQRTAVTPPFDPEQEFPNIPEEQTIPLITGDGLFLHSIARVFATFGSDNRTTYHAQTNPQRNGNWQTKQSFTTLTARADARAWIENNVDITNTNQYSITSSTTEKNGYYYIKKDKITIQNFPQ